MLESTMLACYEGFGQCWESGKRKQIRRREWCLIGYYMYGVVGKYWFRIEIEVEFLELVRCLA